MSHLVRLTALETYSRGMSLTQPCNIRHYFEWRNQSYKTRDPWQTCIDLIDGTIHVCETTVVVLRYVTTDWAILQTVCQLTLLAIRLTGEEVACQIVTVLLTELSISSHLHTISRRCNVSPGIHQLSSNEHSVNSSQSDQWYQFLFTHNRSCMLGVFKTWIGWFSWSPKVCLPWRTETGLSPPSYSPSTWWSRGEACESGLVLKQCRSLFQKRAKAECSVSALIASNQ